jgi:hypothetical protein
MMMDFTVVCGAPMGCVFHLARRKAPEHYWRAASYWWWGSSGLGRRICSPSLQSLEDQTFLVGQNQGKHRMWDRFES